MTAHEYGHAIFEHNLANTVSIFSYIRQLYVQARVIDLAREDLIRRYAKGKLKNISEGSCLPGFYTLQLEIYKNDPSSLEPYKAFCSEVFALTAKSQAVYAQLNEHKRLRDRLARYDELFADVVAVLEFNNLDAVVQIFLIDGVTLPKEERLKVSMRSFAQCPPPEGFLEHDPHSYFAPTRCKIGEFIARSKIPKGRLLKTIFEVLAADLVKPEWGIVTTPSVDNTILIESLHKHLGELEAN